MFAYYVRLCLLISSACHLNCLETLYVSFLVMARANYLRLSIVYRDENVVVDQSKFRFVFSGEKGIVFLD